MIEEEKKVPEEMKETWDNQVDAAGAAEENSTIEETREELAKTYLTFLDQQKWWIIGTWAGLGVNLNPLQKSTIEYLTSVANAEEKKNIFKTIGNNIKKKVMEKIGMQWSGIEWMSIEYDKAKLEKVKAMIIQNKDDKKALKDLIDQVKSGVDIGAVEGATPAISENEQPTQSQEKKITTDVLPIYTTYAALKVGEYISQDEITYVESNAKKIVEDLETKWSLSDIEKIKDVDGNVVLECRGKTPYIHSKAAADLVWLSLLYYKKTGKKFLLESAYRTIDHQKILKKENAAKGTPTADPWYSWHNLWYSIDVSKESRYDEKIDWVTWLKKIAKVFNFNPISSEDWHFDYKDFVDKYYDDREARLPEAQKLNKLFSDEQEPVSAAA